MEFHYIRFNGYPCRGFSDVFVFDFEQVFAHRDGQTQ